MTIRVSSSHIFRLEDESRRDSLIDENLSYANAYMMEARSYSKPHESMFISTNLNNGISDSKLNSKLHAKFHSKYTQDFLLLQTIDCFKLINKYSGSFFSNLEFDFIYVPDSKDLDKISRGNSLKNKKDDVIENFYSDSELLNDNNTQTINFKSKFKYLRKNSHVIIPVVFVFILFIWILY
jgi:hypothetical protein